MPNVGKCKLCKKQKDLMISHAVGDSIFKKILRANSGKAIFISSGEEAIHYSSDSWAEHQLCLSCEKFLNLQYEAYSIGVLRGRNCNFSKSDRGLSFSDLNQHKLVMYFLSIYWRAANSGHPSYKNVAINEECNEYLRNAIFNDIQIPSSKYSVKLSRVVDLSGSEGFSSEVLKELIVSPFVRDDWNSQPKKTTICFIFEGFFIEIYTKRLKIECRRKHGVLSKSKHQLFVPYLNIFDIDEVFNLMVSAYSKHINGNSRLNSSKENNN